MREKVSNRLKHIMKIRNLKQVDIINKSKPYQKKLGISSTPANMQANTATTNLHAHKTETTKDAVH